MTPGLILSNILVAIFNGFACGFNVAFLATGSSSMPALTGALAVMNAGVALWIAVATCTRIVNAYAGGTLSQHRPEPVHQDRDQNQ